MGWSLRIVAWNLWELRGDQRALVETLQDLAPDVLLVQESPRFVLPGMRLDRLARHLERRVLLGGAGGRGQDRSEEHTSELQSRGHLVCRLLLEKKKNRHPDERLTQRHVSQRE